MSAQKLDKSFEVPKGYTTKDINGIICTISNFGDYLDLTNAKLTLPIVYNKKLARKMVYTIHVQAIPIPGKKFLKFLPHHHNMVTTEANLRRPPSRFSFKMPT